MPLRCARHRAVCALLLVFMANCARDSTSPNVGPRTFSTTGVGSDSLPAKQFCTAASPYTEQWVILSRVELVTDRGDGFTITAIDEQDNAQFTTSSTGSRKYVAQFAAGGYRVVAGTLMPRQNGVREGRVERAMTFPTAPEDFTARVFDDSAIATVQVHCLTPVGNDSARTFRVVLK